MITSREDWQGYRNEITDYLDKYLIADCRGWNNYIYNHPIENKWLIRVPGATRGNFEVKNGVITSIELYEDSFCYKKEVLDNLNQFIGRKIDL